MDTLQAVEALSSLAHPNRLAAFRTLVQAGESGLSAGELSDRLHVPPSSLSFHLAHLVRAGLAVQDRCSRQMIYRANYGAMRDLLGYLLENCCGGEPCCGVEGASSMPDAA